MRKIFLTFLIFAISYSGYSQATHAANYSFSTSFQTYDTVAAGTTLATLNADDATQQNVPIGFTFNYCGTNYTNYLLVIMDSFPYQMQLEIQDQVQGQITTPLWLL